MKKIIWYCDRCKEQITGGANIYRLGTDVWSSDADEDDAEYEPGAELCEKCYNHIDEFIALAIRNPNLVCSVGEAQTPKPEKAGTNRINLDLGKIRALHEAGWSNAKIAEEMHTSTFTIAGRLKEIYKEDSDDE